MHISYLKIYPSYQKGKMLFKKFMEVIHNVFHAMKCRRAFFPLRNAQLKSGANSTALEE
jgi:hypothetical protein